MITEADYILEYQGTKEEAQKLGAFYTPPVLGKRMVKKLESVVGKTCFDPTCGYGNLIIQTLDEKVAQGEDPTQALSEVYGNEFDPKNLEICIQNLKVWAKIHNAKWISKMMNEHFHQGDALQDAAYEFPDTTYDLAGLPDENDIEDILAKRSPPEVQKETKKTQAVTKASKKKVVSPEVPEKKAVQVKPSALPFVEFMLSENNELVLKTAKTTRAFKNKSKKDLQSFANALNVLHSKNVCVRGSHDAKSYWELQMALNDVSCKCEIQEI